MSDYLEYELGFMLNSKNEEFDSIQMRAPSFNEYAFKCEIEKVVTSAQLAGMVKIQALKDSAPREADDSEDDRTAADKRKDSGMAVISLLDLDPEFNKSQFLERFYMKAGQLGLIRVLEDRKFTGGKDSNLTRQLFEHGQYEAVAGCYIENFIMSDKE